MCQVDQLEGRQLMTADFANTLYRASDQAGYATITLNDPSNFPIPGAPAPTQAPDQVYISTGGGSAVPGVDYTPVHETVTIAPGQYTQTVQIPVLPADPSRGTKIVQLDISSGPGAAPTDQAYLAIMHSADTTPPTVIGGKMLTKGKLVTGIIITFSKDMAEGPVQDLGNYAVANPRAFLSPKAIESGQIGMLPLRSAVYNPATHAVTLTLAHKVKKFPFIPVTDIESFAQTTVPVPSTSSAAALPPALSPITDSTGNPLSGGAQGSPDGHLNVTVFSSPRLAKALKSLA
jgi:hypothetical protein